MTAPATKFATGPDGSHIAYQVLGSGNVDIVLVNGQVCIDLVWDEPRIERFLRRLASCGRLILFDQRGIGASDRLAPQRERFAMSILEAAAEDLLVVLDTVGSTSAVVIGCTAGAKQSILFAATHPERVTKLVLQDAAAQATPIDGQRRSPDGLTDDAVLDALRTSWGTGLTAHLAPSLLHDAQMRRWFARNERLSVSRSDICALWQHGAEVDVSAALELVQAETLVITHDADPLRPSGEGRFLADRIPHATYVELDGGDTWFFADQRVEDAIMPFVDSPGETRGRANRVLATVLFTDLVSSTVTVVELGDQRWRDLLDTHDSVAARVVALHQGRIVKHTGDGLLTVCDMPGRAVSCAHALRAELAKVGLEVRAGIHTGEIELRGDDVGGVAVHLAARIMALAGPGEVLASRTVKDLTAGSGLTFEPHGSHRLRGIPESWDLYRCVAG